MYKIALMRVVRKEVAEHCLPLLPLQKEITTEFKGKPLSLSSSAP